MSWESLSLNLTVTASVTFLTGRTVQTLHIKIKKTSANADDDAEGSNESESEKGREEKARL